MRSQIADRERISVVNFFTTLHYISRVLSTPQQHFMMSLEKEKIQITPNQPIGIIHYLFQLANWRTFKLSKVPFQSFLVPKLNTKGKNSAIWTPTTANI